MQSEAGAVQPQNPRRWWCEPEVLLLLALVGVGYFARLDGLPVRAEEPRWAQVAYEIQQRGDWIVPREQGDPFLSRPPLHSWIVLASTTLLGTRAAWALRLPSALATLLTTLLIYGYSRTFLSRLGALGAAAAFATLGEMFTTGFQAETEAVFILLVSASLLLWSWGRMRSWHPLVTWIAAYVCVGLAVLAKGPQPPVYFLGSVTVYLFLTRQWRQLFSPAHLAGAVVGATIVLAWMIPCVHRVGLPTVLGILGSDTAGRFREWKMSGVALHLLRYPVEIIGSTLPWSPLLLAFASRDLRCAWREARPQVLFVTISLLIAFPTCWLPPGGQTRYFTPLYPCLAVLIGVVVDRCTGADATSWIRTVWRHYMRITACIMMVCGAGVFIGSLALANHSRWSAWAEKPFVAVGYALAAGLTAVLAWRARAGGDMRQVRNGVLAVACFAVLTLGIVANNIRIRQSENLSAGMAHLKEELPADCQLVSLGHIDALFAYHYGAPIDTQAMPKTPAETPKHEYFCFGIFGDRYPDLPFDWEVVDTVSTDRNHHTPPKRRIVIGRVVQSQ